MFPGMFMRKPDKAAALKQLKAHVAMFGVWVAVVRVTPYILHYLSDEKEELKIESRFNSYESHSSYPFICLIDRQEEKGIGTKRVCKFQVPFLL
ncbi:Mitochondrial import receptor subunit TOM6 -like protein [Gossypium arboreum]|uniref:Mitochondrial import receptor subunit TOM6-like protein n=1 Tax=Gossypium arboreum TaxID=29729 RepID=A0A0B0MFJ0_GOSAR|nr:Mitochondrial import receptor subunit TOM6 -like protein [Gossypium arboreum]